MLHTERGEHLRKSVLQVLVHSDAGPKARVYLKRRSSETVMSGGCYTVLLEQGAPVVTLIH